MHRLILRLFAVSLLGIGVVCAAEEISREQVKGLDEQVQEVKADVLGIAAELNRLEEKLLYPSNTHVSLFVSLVQASTLRLDALEIQLDGKPVARHLYTFKELEGLREGGVQRIYTGNIRTGDHALRVSVVGKTENGAAYQRSENFTITKGVGPKLASITVGGSNGGHDGIALKDW